MNWSWSEGARIRCIAIGWWIGEHRGNRGIAKHVMQENGEIVEKRKKFGNVAKSKAKSAGSDQWNRGTSVLQLSFQLENIRKKNLLGMWGKWILQSNSRYLLDHLAR